MPGIGASQGHPAPQVIATIRLSNVVSLFSFAAFAAAGLLPLRSALCQADTTAVIALSGGPVPDSGDSFLGLFKPVLNDIDQFSHLILKSPLQWSELRLDFVDLLNNMASLLLCQLKFMLVPSQ